MNKLGEDCITRANRLFRPDMLLNAFLEPLVGVSEAGQKISARRAKGALQTKALLSFRSHERGTHYGEGIRQRKRFAFELAEKSGIELKDDFTICSQLFKP